MSSRVFMLLPAWNGSFKRSEVICRAEKGEAINRRVD